MPRRAGGFAYFVWQNRSFFEGYHPTNVRNLLFRLFTLLLTCTFSLLATAAETAPYITVEADYFELNVAEGKAYFRGNVEVTQRNSTFHSSQLTLRLEQITSRITEAKSGDKSSDNDSSADPQNYELSANTLTYDISQDMINGHGNSELKRGNELIRADEISYAVVKRIAYARPTDSGRVRVQFIANPDMPLFPAGLGTATAAN
jgi:lipopolysaccharide transport protein LptA